MTLNEPISQGPVTTIGARCRRCYNCVRSCPAKAIRVLGGQATVIVERCIGCGNCLRVCAQGAKQVQSAVEQVEQLLAGDAPTVAILAPSYPAAYDNVSAGQVVTAARALGFTRVMEVGFGAEMVAHEYARLLANPPDRPIISTPCPALVNYVQKYMPDLVPNLAPIVSPMVALGRAIKQKLLPGAQVVFVGPCVAKKTEIRDPEVADSTDAVMTFRGFREMTDARALSMGDLEVSRPDGPLPRFGALFPVSGGLLKAAAIQADLMDDSIVVVEGARRCLAALRQLQSGDFPAHFLDALLCEGCIAGPAFDTDKPPLARKHLVTAHVRWLAQLEPDVAQSVAELSDIDLSRGFEAQDLSLDMPTETEIRDILARTNKFGPEDELNCGACGYRTCREKAIAVYQGLAEQEMCLPYLIDQLQINIERLSRSKSEIDKARELAVRARQLASMGQLAADVAHEISNPLSNIIVFAQLLRDGLPQDDPQREDVATITAEALHCREVMTRLQQFARQKEPQFESCSVATVVDRALAEVRQALAETGIEVVREGLEDMPPIVADPAQLSQALVNLLTNSIEAMGDSGEITIEARYSADRAAAVISIRDTGRGIPPSILPRVFQPFVSTKTERRGAGLGLAVAHGILQAHAGDIHIDSRPGAGTTVSVSIPLDVAPATVWESAKVLVVDDDPDFLEQHRLMLEGMGFNVVTAERSDEAIEVTNREIPDAFVLDLMMERPDSGARIARTLRRDPRFRRAPIIILTSVVDATGFEFRRNPREVLEWMRADAWFDKPPPMAELANTLRRLLTGEVEEVEVEGRETE